MLMCYLDLKLSGEYTAILFVFLYIEASWSGSFNDLMYLGLLPFLGSSGEFRST